MLVAEVLVVYVMSLAVLSRNKKKLKQAKKKESEKWADYGLAEVKTLTQHFFPFNKNMFDQVTAELSLLKYHM